MNSKKLLTLSLLVTSLVTGLSLNAMQRGTCPKNKTCPMQQHHPHRQHHPHHHQLHGRPEWRDVKNDKGFIAEGVIEVKENDAWVQYKKGNKNCPQKAHGHHGNWHGHRHPHHGEHRVDHRHVKYQINDKNEKVDGVLNVFENGTCWEYIRAGSTKMTPEQLERIIEESLHVE